MTWPLAIAIGILLLVAWVASAWYLNDRDAQRLAEMRRHLEKRNHD